MNYLAIDTSGKNLTMALSVNGKLYTYDDKECGVNHSVAIMQKIEDLSITAQFDLKNADFFACVTGAGSFTGIRIGVSTVKALCFAYKKPCLNITSFDTLAYNKQGGKVLAVIDAKHDCYYVCGYNDQKVDYPPAFVTLEQLKQLTSEYSLVASEDLQTVEFEKVSVLQGLIKAVELKQGEITPDLESLVPLYVRKSQAEEGR